MGSIRQSTLTARLFVIAVLLAALPALAGCQSLTPAVPTPGAGSDLQPGSTPYPETMITFIVELPEPLPAGDSIYLDVLDEVTGLAFNPVRYELKEVDPTHYMVILPFPLQSVVKYRYTRSGSSMVQEHTSDGRAVRYRLYLVNAPGQVTDRISRWTDTTYVGAAGRISGVVTDASNGEPVLNVLVAAGGSQTFSGADGSFVLEDLPPGVHNLVAYPVDGAFAPFQQGALVAGDSNTPAPLFLKPVEHVNVTFTVRVPEETPAGVPVHLAGSLYQLGSTFADLVGGVNTLAARMPTMTQQAEGVYSLTLSLPVGADIRYKYTLGDGIWNAEHTGSGGFRIRQLIVPEEDTQITDTVETWRSSSSAPITFDVTVPAGTPQNDIVSIQFKPTFSWTEPLPMWRISGSNRWVYILYSPLESLDSIGYRFCRNNLCGSADDIRSMGPNASGSPVSPSRDPQTVQETIAGWSWFGIASGPATVPDVAVQPRASGFMAGFELLPAYHPSWQPRFSAAFADIRGANANLAVLTPSLTFTRQDPPLLEIAAGNDPLWLDTIDQIESARSQGLQVALFPTLKFPGGSAAWWDRAERDSAWWNVWFDQYRSFLLDYAGLAEQSAAEALIIGGESILPAYPGGVLIDGESSGVPSDALDRWRSIIGDVRQRYSGRLLLALPFPAGVQEPPEFLQNVDGIYLLWSAAIAGPGGGTEGSLAAAAGSLLDELVLPLAQESGKPVVLAVAYPSAEGGAAGCVVGIEDSECLLLDALNRPNPDIPEVTLDLQEQANAYNALLLAVNQRAWIEGFVSRGYYPPAALQDKSTSVHGKPARDVLWWWYERLIGAADQ